MSVKAAGESHVGLVRERNEDTLIVIPSRGLYAVFDGMGGVAGGDVASAAARDRMREVVESADGTTTGRALLDQAIQAACGHVHAMANANRARSGMGTTVVACLVEGSHVTIGHVGDSRAYLLREGRMLQLTRDHTIVAELVERGAITADEGERHAYKNVLSRNLGARPGAKVDFAEVTLQGGDRLLLCSDGLTGFATTEAIQYLLGSGDLPEQVARDLIEVALRGGGGDNVSAVVIEAMLPPPTATAVVRTRGASAWWQWRGRFLAAADKLGLAESPIGSSIPASERVGLIAGSLAQAIFHDLEKSSGINVWTYAHNLATGWIGQGGEWAPLRGLIDTLTAATRVVIDEMRETDPTLVELLDTALTRALVVGELAIGSVLDEQIRKVDAELIAVHAASMPPETERESSRFLDQPTIPFIGAHQLALDEGTSPELKGAIRSVLRATGAAGASGAPVEQVLTALEALATEGSSEAAVELSARELYGVRTVDEAGVSPLFSSLERARLLMIANVHRLEAADSLKASVLRRLATVHHHLALAQASLVVEAAGPASDRLRQTQKATAELRAEATELEQSIAELELRSATVIEMPRLESDPTGESPWEAATQVENQS